MHHQPRPYHSVLDRFGVSASTLCAIHCAAVPFLVSVLPAIGLGFLGGPTFEMIMIGTSLTIATFSLGSSYRVHRRLNPLMMMVSGATLMVFNFVGHESHSPLVETLHPYIAAFAGLMIACAHWINIRLCRHCQVCEHDHDHAGEHDHAAHAEPGHVHAAPASPAVSRSAGFPAMPQLEPRPAVIAPVIVPPPAADAGFDYELVGGDVVDTPKL